MSLSASKILILLICVSLSDVLPVTRLSVRYITRAQLGASIFYEGRGDKYGSLYVVSQSQIFIS